MDAARWPQHSAAGNWRRPTARGRHRTRPREWRRAAAAGALGSWPPKESAHRHAARRPWAA
eukprot:9112071-Lingulodinium_polyedra.AAC.1